MVNAGLDYLKQKEVDSFYKFSIEGTELSLRLYKLAYQKLFEFCVGNKIPVHPNRLIIEPQVVNKHRTTEKLDIPDDIDVPSKIDDILTGEESD